MSIPAAFDLSGRVAIVTGAGSPSGIGFASARLLAELGAAVMVSATTSRIEDRVSELRGAGFDAAGVAGDLTDENAASRLVSAALRQWGRLDIVVNNAGMISTASPAFESGAVSSLNVAAWQASLARNLTTAFPVTKGGPASHDQPRLGTGHHGGQRDRPGNGDARRCRLRHRQSGHGRPHPRRRDRCCQASDHR